MSSQVLRDRSGIKIGEITQEGFLLVIRDKSGNKKGSYDPQTNTTRDASGNRVGTGNLLTTLL